MVKQLLRATLEYILLWQGALFWIICTY